MALQWAVTGGVARRTALAVGDLMRGLEPNVYTGMRTFRGKLLALDVHVERLRKSAARVGLPPPSDEEVRQLVRAAMGTPEPGHDILLMMVVSREGLVGHAKQMPARPAAPVRARVTRVDRRFGEVKDGAWVREREALHWPEGVNELLLLNAEGELLEGASSNLFVVRPDGALQTASEGILSGSIRRFVLQAAEQEGTPVDFSPPKWAERDTWQAAFLTSTSRLLLPLNEITDAEGMAVRFPDSNPLLERLSARLEDILAAQEQPAK